MDTSQASPEEQVDQVENSATSPSIHSTWEEEQSEAVDPWLDSLLATIDPGQSLLCYHLISTSDL